MRKQLIVGNWKLNGNKKMINNFVNDLNKVINKKIFFDFFELVIAPPNVYLEYFKSSILNKKIFLAAQNVDIHKQGPFTGEVSADMLKDVGTKYVIIGHSERRILHGENDDMIAKKFQMVKSCGLIPILCIGETDMEYKNGRTKEVCMQQIKTILKYNSIDDFKNTVIAYEPVWAIGTGQSASLEHIKQINLFIKKFFNKNKINIFEKITIQYGGSVNKKNYKSILDQKYLNGLLIGNASLTIDFFKHIKRSIIM